MHKLIASIALSVLSFSTFAQSSADEVVEMAGSIGIAPESLVLADLEEYSEVILTGIGQEAGLLTAIQTIESSLTQLTDQVGSVLDELSLNPTDETLLSSYQSASQALQSAMNSLETARNSLFEAATDTLAPASIDAIVTWQTASRYRVPPEFRVLDLTPPEWKAVEKALRAEQRSIILEEELDESYATLLATIRALPGVIAAQEQLSLHLTEVEGDFGGFEPQE